MHNDGIILAESHIGAGTMELQPGSFSVHEGRFLKKCFLLNGEVVQKIFTLIFRYILLASHSNLLFFFMRFPLIEKAIHFCHTAIDETVSIGKIPGQKTSTTFFDQRR